MKVEIIRQKFLPDRTLGEMVIDGNHFGWILEDKVREDGQFISGETAIPYGEYRLITSFSNRFQKIMPQVINKRGNNILFHGLSIDACGIRIHGGNGPADTLGCPLLGAHHNENTVFDCGNINKQFMTLLRAACVKEEVYLVVSK